MKKIPKFIVALKSRTIMSTERSKLYVRPQQHLRDKLLEISRLEGVSEQKLVEYAIEMLWKKWAKERKAK